MTTPLKIHKVKDDADNYYITPKSELLAQLPSRAIFNGRSLLSGKTTYLTNYLILPEFMGDYFKGDNIYIISGSLDIDNKIKHIIELKEIPDTNLFNEYSNSIVQFIYNKIEDDYKEKEEQGEVPEQCLLILDDCGHDTQTKKSDILNSVFTRGRHINLSCWVLLQRFTQASTTMRSNASCFVLFTGMSNKELDLVAEDVNFLTSKKQFIKMYRDQTKEKYSFIYINIGNPIDKLYLDQNFQPIDVSQYE